ncbi:MAG: hypothetical protein Q9M39_00930 [Sulfurovum sp.]|nr:hypothetical protein [Sulfurovum sp.]
MFKNTMDAALVINTDLPDTLLLYAAVGQANSSIGALDNFDKINENGNVVHLFTAQNKSIENLTLTGSYYYAPDLGSDGLDMDIIWGDAKYAGSGFSAAVQGGQMSYDGETEDLTAYGIKVGAKLAMFDLFAAYSSTEGPGGKLMRVTNLATTQHPAPGLGIKSPLYTQMVLDNIGNHQAQNSDWVVANAKTKLFGGTATVAYGQAIDNDTAFSAGTTGAAFGKNPWEFDLMYKTKVTEDITVFAAYVLTDRDQENRPGGFEEDSNNFVRFWARYNF